MWLEAKSYYFKTENDTVTSEDILSNINLKVNDILTTVKLSDLFLRVKEIEFDKEEKILEVQGWSILERIIPETGELRITEGEKFTDVKLTFYSEELGNMTLSEFETLHFMSDKELSDEKVKAFDAKIIELSTHKKGDDHGNGEVSPHSNPSPAITNKKYEIAKARFVNNGYKEYPQGNFKLLVKESGDSKTVLLIEIIDENKLIQLTSPEEIVDGFYQFSDSDRQRTVKAKIIDGKLEVEVVPEQEEVKS